MKDPNGLICAYLLDGKGGAKEVDWDFIRSWNPQDGFLWIHLEREHPESRRWLYEESNLEELTCEALLAEEIRPRSTLIYNKLLVILRGVNLNPGADPDDMVSIRMCFEESRVISFRKPKLMAIQDIREEFAMNKGPKGPGDFLVHMTERLIERMGPVLDDLNEEVDELEEQVLESPSYEVRIHLSKLRRKAIGLRRHLAPQRDVMSHLQTERVPWLEDLHRAQLREIGDRLLRYVEDLDSSRERAAVTQEELAGKIADQMNKTMYVLSLVASIFMPLGLLTGLLGINVGGIPGSENPTAFIAVCLILVILAIFQLLIFRRFKWF